MTSPTRGLRFLAFNTLSDTWKDASLRQALACVLDQEALISALGGRASSLASFVSPQESLWYDADAALPCHGLDAAARLTQAVSILKAGGYTWTQEPSGQNAGVGLVAADGKALPPTQLMTPSSDDLRIAAGAYVQQQARLLGIPVTTATVTTDAIDFAVFSSHRYDMALLGWNVSPFPGYLCDWFGVGQPLQYDSVRMTSGCGNFDATSDLDRARQQIAEVQSILAADVPIIPLYTSTLHEPYRNVAYPFSQVLDGLSGVYGAPGLAFPASP
jgi:ABC-type transport system substrate-binding protein